MELIEYLAALSVEQEILVLALLGVALVLFGCYKMHCSRRADQLAWMATRAPILDFTEAKPGDDCWLRGKIVSTDFVLVPHFAQKAVLYWYTKEGVGDSKERSSRAETRFDCVPFSLVDGSHQYAVRSEEAAEVHTSQLVVTIDNYRHLASYLGQGDYLNVLGVVSDDGTSVGSEGHVPLVLTSMSPGRFGAFMQDQAGSNRIVAFLVIWLGLALATPRLWYDFFLQPELSEEWVLRGVVFGFCLFGLPLVLYWAVNTYNVLTRRYNQIQNARHLVAIDALQRAEIIPKLELLIKEFCAHEQTLLERLACLRSEASETGSTTVENEFRAVEQSLHALHEEYPALKTSDRFSALFTELTRLENKIAYDRHFYNENVKVYNTQTASFPTVLVAQATGHRPLGFYASELAREKV